MMRLRYFLAVLTGLLFFIAPAAAQTLTFDVTDVPCHNGAGGSIDLSVAGGTPPLSYLWSNNANTEDLDNLPVGTYSVTVTDGTEASVTGSGTVNEPAALELGTSVTRTRCPGEQNGSIALSVSGGTAPYAYVWTGGVHTQNLNGSKAGAYSVTVTDANGCTATTSDIILDPPVLSGGSGGWSHPSCSGLADGNIDLNNASGGTPPYNYYWSNGATTASISNLNAGTYTLTVVDANGCSFTSGSFTLQVTENVLVIPTVTNPSCGNADGAISAVAFGTAPPYQFVWSNGSTGPQISNLPTGTYTVTATDANGCFDVATHSITPFTATISAQLTQCAYQLNIQPSGGTFPYTRLWSNGSTGAQLSNVPGGLYGLTVTDATGCTAVTSVDLPVLVPLVVDITTVTDVCRGGLIASGLNFEAVDFLWSTGSVENKLSNIPAGAYTVTLTSQEGCTAFASIVTTQAMTEAYFYYQNMNNTVGDVNCADPNSGFIELHILSPALPLTYLWANGATTQIVTDLSAGFYRPTVTDANGCTIQLFVAVDAPALPVSVVNNITPTNCFGFGAINVSVSGGAPPYTYGWSNGFTVQDITGLGAGDYFLTVTGSNGCTSTASVTVPQGPVFSASITEISNDCNSVTLQPAVTGATGPFQFIWSGPNGFTSSAQVITVNFTGIYTLTVSSSAGCEFETSYFVEVYSNGPCGSIAGSVIYDLDSNCVANPGEPALSGWLIRAVNATDTIYGATNFQGNYFIYAPVGDYTMEVLPPNGLWTICPTGPGVSVTDGNTISAGSILVKGLFPCAALNVSIGTSILRRCFNNNTYTVQYCNQGTEMAVDAYVLIQLDPLLVPSGSSFSYTDLGDNLLRFDVGNLAVGACGFFHLYVHVSCDAALGRTHCTEARIYPNGNCVPPDQNWSGASLRVTSQCNQDSVRFNIKNVGQADMQSTSDYIVVEDAVMLMQAPFQLASGDSTMVAVPANGSTWRVEVGQVPFHPGLSAPALSVEGCSNTSSFSTGFVTQFPNDEAAPWINIDCTQNIGSFDPNDKQGFPVGYGEQHYIRPGTELEYMIRFQNTGTDTAFTVRIADTLSLWLDPATIRPGIGSHPYEFNLTGHGIAEFLFENILLPDSNVNQAGSNGFVKFSIYPRADAPLETLIENDAAIYFDFNEPVITNTTYHRLGENFILVGAWQPQRPEYQVSVSPNPFSGTAQLEVKGLTSTQPIHLQIIDLQGTIVHDETAAGPVLTLKKEGLPSGIYLFKLDQKGVLIGSGKLMVRD